MTIDDVEKCKSYTEAIKLIFDKDYVNKSIINKVKKWCFDNLNFDLESHINTYKNRKNYCLNCGKEIVGRNRLYKKFCCQSCAATYNNKLRGSVSNEQKERTSATMLKKNADKDNLSLEEYLCIPRTKDQKLKYKCTCKICGKEFYSRHKNTIYCSQKCSNSDPDVKQKLRDRVQERKENGTFSGWQSRNITSYPEQFWIDVLNNNAISFIREDFTTKKYFLDFLINKNGKKIDLEIDGKQHKYEDRKYHDEERDKYLQQLGYIVYRVEWNSINNERGKALMKSKINDFLDFYNKL